MHLTDVEKEELIHLLTSGQPLPERWRHRLFPSGNQAAEIGKEYRLVYDGKLKREEVLAQTPAAPWQLVREFCTEHPHSDGWRNLLVWGDNLLALRELLADQQGADRFGTRGKIKLIYIDPPFATRQDFMKDKEKAYRDKVLGAQFIEFLRRRLILLRELLADDGSIFVHLDWEKGHYIKAVLDEVFGEENFVTEIIWRRTTAHFTAERFAFVHDSLFQYSRAGKFLYRKPPVHHSEKYLAVKYKHEDETGTRYRLCFPVLLQTAKAAKTHVANESFNPDFFIKVSDRSDILVVEVKAEGDDSNRNRAKCRDGLAHFETANKHLTNAGESWRYNFYFLSPEDYTSFFEKVRTNTYVGWRSGLMQDLRE